MEGVASKQMNTLRNKALHDGERVVKEAELQVREETSDTRY